ncbi:MAG: ribonuclease E/G, partial [Mesorhizobium sp.]
RRAPRSKKAVEETVSEKAPERAAELPAEPAAAEPELTAAAAAPTEAEAQVNAHPTRRKPQSIDTPAVPVVSSNVSEEAKTEEKPKRAGWWQRKGFF